jgi:hypothetical protein
VEPETPWPFSYDTKQGNFWSEMTPVNMLEWQQMKTLLVLNNKECGILSLQDPPSKSDGTSFVK